MSSAIRVSFWDSVKKKTICKTRSVKKGETHEEVRKQLIEWRENGKKESKKEKARLLLGIEPNVEPEPEPEGTYSDTELSEPIEVDKYKVHDLVLDIDVSGTGCVLAFLGASKISGKTYLMKHIYNQVYKDKDFCTVLYAANSQQPIYDDIPKEVIKTTDFNPDIPKIMYKISKKVKNKYHWLNWLDDQVGNNIKSSQTLLKMITSYRNSNMSVMVSLQTPTLLTKTNRSQAHYMFLGRVDGEITEDVVNKYLRNFLGGSTNKITDKIKLYNKLTSNYQWIVIDKINSTIKVMKIKSQ